MGAIQPRITDDMNNKLMEQYTEDEVRRALFQMHQDKAPGMDGYSALFYQRFWEVTKVDVCKEILNFLNHDMLDSELNVTQIILLPKKAGTLSVGDFRPISLCNVAMKIITKVLANRLSACLPAVIAEYQSAFIKN